MLLDLPKSVLFQIFQQIDPDDLNRLLIVCKSINCFVKINRNLFQSRLIYHVDLDHRRIRFWHTSTCCDRVPFVELSSFSKYFRNVILSNLTINQIDEAFIDFLVEHAKKFNLKVRQLRLIHSINASHKSISHLLDVTSCEVIDFSAVHSNITASNFLLKGYQKLRTICFEMDDTIDNDFFEKILDFCPNATKFIFHECDKIPPDFIHQIFEKWQGDQRNFDALSITANKNISFDFITANLEIKQVGRNQWEMERKSGDKALITVKRSSYHFFLAFEVNEFHVENILNKIKSIE